MGTALVATAASGARKAQRPHRRWLDMRYIFVAPEPPARDPAADETEIPPMSLDGGNQQDFEEYWSGNRTCRRFAGGWVERRSHPQVNVEAYWFNEATGETAWSEPVAEEEPPDTQIDGGSEKLVGTGPEWDMSPADLKKALAFGEAEGMGLKLEELARRAVAEFEAFEPRVLSWHDFTHITFWFYGGLDRGKAAGGKSFFESKGATRDMFAGDAFFRTAANLLKERAHRMHPIPLTYFIWTFARAGVKETAMMEAVGDYLCEAGRLPMMDRCSLGTMVWNFGKVGVRHDRLFEDAATELSRPNRVRSLAPRNFQNIMIAYRQRKHWNKGLFDAMSAGMIRLLDNHDPTRGKLARELLFSYTCKDGSEVLADSFRVRGLTVILRTYHSMGIGGPDASRALEAMARYTIRFSASYSPRLREPGDCCEFMIELINTARDVKTLEVSHLWSDIGKHYHFICRNAVPRDCELLKSMLSDRGVKVSGSPRPKGKAKAAPRRVGAISG